MLLPVNEQAYLFSWARHQQGALTGMAVVLREATQVALRRGPYSTSREGMTPIWRDPPAALPLAAVLTALLLNPRNGIRLASMTIGNYSLGPVINSLPGLDPGALCR